MQDCYSNDRFSFLPFTTLKIHHQGINFSNQLETEVLENQVICFAMLETT